MCRVSVKKKSISVYRISSVQTCAYYSAIVFFCMHGLRHKPPAMFNYKRRQRALTFVPSPTTPTPTAARPPFSTNTKPYAPWTHACSIQAVQVGGAGASPTFTKGTSDFPRRNRQSSPTRTISTAAPKQITTTPAIAPSASVDWLLSPPSKELGGGAKGADVAGDGGDGGILSSGREGGEGGELGGGVVGGSGGLGGTAGGGIGGEGGGLG